MADCKMAGSSDVVDFSCLCRLCATETCLSKGMHIYKEEGSIREVKKKITILLPIQITLADNLPKMVCNECINKLDVFYEFREKTIQTEHLLVDILNKLDSANESKICAMDKLEEIDERVNNSDDDRYEDTPLIETVNENQQIIFSECNTMTEENLDIVHAQHNSTSYMNEVKPELVKVESFVDCENSNQSVVITLENTQEAHKHREQIEHYTCNEINTLIKTEDKKIITNKTSNDESIIVEEQLNEIFLKLEPQPICSEDNVQMVYYFCNLCTDTYETKNELIEHYQTHWYKCDLCTTMFRDKASFQNHMKSVHNEVVCNNESKTNEDTVGDREKNVSNELKNKNCIFKTPKKNSADKAPTTASQKICKTCGKSYRSNYKLNEHMRKHTGEQPFKCQTCMKGFRSKIGLAQHEATHTGVYDYFCPTCGKGFQCRSYLAVHQRVHSDAKPYPCITCERQFKSKQSLLDHMNRHLGVKPYICNICGKGFITKGLCKSHQKVHSGADNRQYPCPICKKLFVSKSYLATHARIHTGEKPFICEVCGKGFLTRVDLRIHSTVHTGEKSFVCEICGKAFARRDALRCHRRSHTGERPYSCDVCGQSFTQFTPMAIHKRLHTGERPYECDVCLRTFVSRSTMMAHRKKHDP